MKMQEEEERGASVEMERRKGKKVEKESGEKESKCGNQSTRVFGFFRGAKE